MVSNVICILRQAAALETAKLIASKSPVAVVGTKHLILHARDHTYVFFCYFRQEKVFDFVTAFKTISITLRHGTH